MNETEIDHDYTREIVCPWCGYVYSDSYEYSEGEGQECEHCGQNFDMYRHIDITYCTYKTTPIIDAQTGEQKG